MRFFGECCPLLDVSTMENPGYYGALEGADERTRKEIFFGERREKGVEKMTPGRIFVAVCFRWKNTSFVFGRGTGNAFFLGRRN